MFRKNISGILLSLIVCVALLICGEIFFRVFYPQSGFSVTYAPWGWRHLPNSKVTFYREVPEFHFDLSKRPYPIPISYNSKGLRDYEYSYSKPSGVFRILMLGDSWSEDMGSFFANTPAKCLERKLNSLGYPQRFEVINCGHYAFDNAQEYMFYLKEGYKYDPDLVIVLNSGDTAKEEYAAFSADGKLVLKYKSFTPAQKMYRLFVNFCRRHSHLASFLLNRTNRIQGFKNVLVKYGYKEKDEPIPDVMVDDHRVYPMTDVDRAVWSQFSNVLKEKGVPLVVFLCHSYPGYDPLLPEDRRSMLSNGILLLDNRFGPVQAEALRKEEILSGTYDRNFESNRLGYKANEKAADLIVSFMKDHDLLPKVSSN